MKKIMLIGFGAMAQAVIERLPAGVAIGWIVARESHHAAIHTQFGDAVMALGTPVACADTPDLVLECASQQAVAQYGEDILRRGWHLAVISTGALADSALEQRLLSAGGKLTLLSGATLTRCLRRAFSLKAAPARRRACSRRTPTWRRRWRSVASGWTRRACS